MVTAWRLERIPLREIARRLNVNVSTVVRRLSLKPAQERKPTSTRGLSKKVIVRRRKIKRLVLTPSTERPGCRKYPSTYSIARQCRLEGLQVSETTVRRDLAALGFVSRRRQRGVAFTAMDEQLRLEFANNCTAEDILFSDEKMFGTNDVGCPSEWVLQGNTPSVRQTARWCPTLHVWGMIGIGVKKMVILPKGAIDAAKYKLHCLQRVVVPTVEKLRAEGRVVTFMQDNARPHTAHANLNYLGSKLVKLLMWPARSPDLNPIENLWAWLQRKVSDRGPRDEEELRQFVTAEWEAIPQSLIDEYVRSFQRRLAEVRRRKGRRL